MMNDFIKIFLYKLLNAIAFFALGTFIISMFMLLRGEKVGNNLLFSFMLMFSLLSCATSLGEIYRLRKNKVFHLESFQFSPKRALVIVLCFVPLTALVVYNFSR